MATLTYNTVSFTSLYSTKISARPVLDEAQRTTTHIEHRLEVVGYIHASGAVTDTTWASLRKLLTACGGALTYQNKGYGDLVVNGTSSVKDAAWGPIPEILDFTPLGGDALATRIHWAVTTRIPECDSASYTKEWMEWNWESVHDIDGDGYTTLRINGHLIIPMTRTAQDNRVPPDIVDRCREQILPPVALGFQRRDQSWRMSADKRRLDFSWVDQEIPAAMPDDVTRIDARHSMRATLKDGGFKKWIFGLDATITLARGIPRDRALKAFLGIIESRTKDLRKKKDVKGTSLFIPLDLSFEEDVFGRTSRFNFSALVISRTSIGLLLKQSKLWYPVDGTDWGKWRTSLEKANATTARGYANLKVPASADLIVDLCRTGGDGNRRLEAKPKGPPRVLKVLGETDDADDDLGVKIANLTPDNSWVQYRMRAAWGEVANVARHRPLPTKAVGDLTDSRRRMDVSGSADDIRGAVGAPGFQRGDEPAEVHQRAAGPTRTLILSGVAVRLGYRVPTPKIDSVSGVVPTELGRDVQEDMVGALGGVPVYRLLFEVEYALPQAPTGHLPSLADPILGVGTITGTAEKFTGVTR